MRVDGTVVGTDLAGQDFTSPLYFHSRPSATTPPYNPSATTFANLGPEHGGPEGRGGREHRRGPEARAALQPRACTARDLPVDMVTTSGSGVDPDITPANARLQANRIAAHPFNCTRQRRAN